MNNRTSRSIWLTLWLLPTCIVLFGYVGCQDGKPQIAPFTTGLRLRPSLGGVITTPMNSGGTGPYLNFLWRETNCSLTLGIADSSNALVKQTADYQDILHTNSGSSTTPDAASSCPSVTTGITSQYAAIVGKFSNGNVAVANISDDGVQVTVINSTTTTVVSQTDYPTLTSTEINSDGAAVFGIASADLNGDGVPDIVVANLTNQGTGTGSLSILLGKGDGTFSTGQVLSVPISSPPATPGR